MIRTDPIEVVIDAILTGFAIEYSPPLFFRPGGVFPLADSATPLIQRTPVASSLAYLAEHRVDAIISDYLMPGALQPWFVELAHKVNLAI